MGPGREEPEPSDLREVLIGYFGPNDPNHPTGGTVWLGASLAIEEANKQGGYKGLPFRLVPGWAANPWTGGISTVARMVYAEKIWALLGSIDGATTHLAEQVVVKALLTLIDPASTDTSVNYANVPWMFSCPPSDNSAVEVIGQALLDSGAGSSFSILSGTDHDSRATTNEFKLFLAHHKIAPAKHLEFQNASPEIANVTGQIAESGVHAIVILADAADTATAVNALRARHSAMLILAGPYAGRKQFLDMAGEAAVGVQFPSLLADSDKLAAFRSAWQRRYGYAPDYPAVHGYDATSLLIATIRKAGLNRARIRDAVQALSPWQGVSGEIRWNPAGRNVRSAKVATIQ